MAAQKRQTRRRKAARKPVIEVEATEIVEAEGTPENLAQTTDDGGSEPLAAGSADPSAPSGDTNEDKVQGKSTGEAGGENGADGAVPEDTPAVASNRSDRAKWMAAAGVFVLIAGAAGGAWLYRDYGAQYFPSPELERFAAQQGALNSSLQEKIAGLEKSLQDAAAREASMSEDVKALKALAGELQNQIKASDATTALKRSQNADETARKALEQAQLTTTSVEDLKAAVAAAAKAVPPDVAGAGEAIKAAQVQISALNLKVDDLAENLANRPENPALAEQVKDLNAIVKKLESSFASLREDAAGAIKVSMANAAGAKALSDAVSSLRTRLASGGPFADDLSALAKSLPDDAAVKTLTRFAETGVETKEKLISDFTAVQTALAGSTSNGSAQVEEKGGFLSTLQNRLSSIIKIRKVGAQDWQAISIRMAGDGAQGDLAAMVRHMDGISAQPPEALDQWLKSARQRLAADAAMQELSLNVMARIATTGKTGG